MTLLFVADVIPRELANIVELMSDQMRAEERAVERQYFVAPEGTTRFKKASMERA